MSYRYVLSGVCVGQVQYGKLETLYNDLFQNYNSDLIPSTANGGKTQVYMGTALRQIMRFVSKILFVFDKILNKLQIHDAMKHTSRHVTIDRLLTKGDFICY